MQDRIHRLSSKDVARALGVSESTIRRWVDAGSIPSSRTEGGHRRISMGDLIEFTRSTGRLLLAPEAIGLRGGLAAQDEIRDGFRESVVEGRDSLAVDLLLTAYAGGRTVAELCDEVFQPAMEHVGTLWRGGHEGILIEHRASVICHAALHRLRGVRPVDEGPVAIGAALSGDPYSLPSLMAATVLQSIGYRATDLGTGLPLPVLSEAIEDHEPVLVWIAIAHISDPTAVAAELTDLVDRHVERVFVVGGRLAGLLELPSRENLHRARAMTELHALAKGLRQAHRRR